MTITELRAYILRQLGSPQINVELTTDQLNDAIGDAVSRFTERHYDATIENLYGLQLVNGTSQYELPDTIKFVKHILPGNSIFSAMSETENILLPLEGTPFFDYIFKARDFSTIMTTRMNIQSWEQAISNQNIQFDFNATMGLLSILGDVSKVIDDYSNSGMVYLLVQECEDPELIYGNRWVKKYATALAMKTWGFLLSKYSGVPLPGGGTINGELFMTRADDEIAKLEEQLEDEFVAFPNFLVG